MSDVKYSKCCGKYLTRETVLIEKRIDVVGKYKDKGPMICSGCKKQAFPNHTAIKET